MTPRRSRRTSALLAALGAATLVTACRDSAPPPAATIPAWLAARAESQELDLAESQARYDFRFREVGAASGITFVSRIVDDAGRRYKPVHYDHGSGLAAADVDGDSLVDLFFVSQLGRSELWRNRGGGRFEDITERAGLVATDRVDVGASFADIDNDGDPDLFVTAVRTGNRLYENLGDGRFRDITDVAGVGYRGHSAGALFLDYDRDGLLDLFVANVGRFTTEERGAGGYYVGMAFAFYAHTMPGHAEPSRLYRNLGGNRFADVTRAVGLADSSWSGDAVPFDVNGDGWEDLYILNMQGEDHLWVNDRGQRFRDSTAAYFARTPFGTMGAKVFDHDGDQRLDLFLTDMHSDMFEMIPPGDWAAEARKPNPAAMPGQLFPHGRERLHYGNALFSRKSERGAFDERSDAARVENYWPWGPSVADLNADGFDDLLIVSSMNFPFRYAVNSLLLNQGNGRFRAAEFALGVEPRADGETEQVWFEAACGPGGADAGTPLCDACRDPNGAANACRPRSDGSFAVMGARGARSAVIADLDRDGDLDIVTNEFNASPRVLLSDLSGQPNVRAIQVHLRGTRSNRQGLGARVTVSTRSDRRSVQVQDGKSGYLSQSALPLTFGLGRAREATRVEVRWPSGVTQVLEGPIPAGSVVEVVEAAEGSDSAGRRAGRP